ncbi:MalY/PatB family protein [Hutsoniella sourekii]
MTIQEFVDKYYVDRKGTRSLKWDLLEERFGDPDLLPLWVADMDFRVADSITQALNERVSHGVYGYTFPGDPYYQAYNQWMQDHFGLEVDPEWMRYAGGVVQAIYYYIHAFTEPDQAILIQTPVYYPFHNAVKDTGRQLVTVDLKNKGGEFTIDFQAFEQAIIDKQVRLYIHCSPHNPVGRVWTHEEQEQLFEICARHDVLIISDEIHQDFIFHGEQVCAYQVAAGKYRDRILLVNSATKSFNLAGLTHCTLLIADAQLRQTYDDYARTIVQTEANIMGLVATQAAYEGGQEWLDAVKEVIYSNYQLLKRELAEADDRIIVSPLEGTYLSLVDLRQVVDPSDIQHFIQDQCGLAIDYGEWFGEGYQGFIRINLATKPEWIHQACQRLIQALSQDQ